MTARGGQRPGQFRAPFFGTLAGPRIDKIEGHPVEMPDRHADRGFRFRRIVQTPEYVAIQMEKIHDVRIIPLDGRPHLSASIAQWNGDPRGRWEGTTLVVETANFNGKAMIATSAAGGRLRGVAQSDAFRLVERFTRTI